MPVAGCVVPRVPGVVVCPGVTTPVVAGVPAPEAAPGEVDAVPPVVWASATDEASANAAVISNVRIWVSYIALC